MLLQGGEATQKLGAGPKAPAPGAMEAERGEISTRRVKLRKAEIGMRHLGKKKLGLRPRTEPRPKERTKA